jgi:hypothetical protein
MATLTTPPEGNGWLGGQRRPISCLPAKCVIVTVKCLEMLNAQCVIITMKYLEMLNAILTKPAEGTTGLEEDSLSATLCPCSMSL